MYSDTTVRIRTVYSDTTMRIRIPLHSQSSVDFRAKRGKRIPLHSQTRVFCRAKRGKTPINIARPKAELLCIRIPLCVFGYRPTARSSRVFRAKRGKTLVLYIKILESWIYSGKIFFSIIYMKKSITNFFKIFRTPTPPELEENQKFAKKIGKNHFF